MKVEIKFFGYTCWNGYYRTRGTGSKYYTAFLWLSPALKQRSYSRPATYIFSEKHTCSNRTILAQPLPQHFFLSHFLNITTYTYNHPWAVASLRGPTPRFGPEADFSIVAYATVHFFFVFRYSGPPSRPNLSFGPPWAIGLASSLSIWGDIYNSQPPDFTSVNSAVIFTVTTITHLICQFGSNLHRNYGNSFDIYLCRIRKLMLSN